VKMVQITQLVCPRLGSPRKANEVHTTQSWYRNDESNGTKNRCWLTSSGHAKFGRRWVFSGVILSLGSWESRFGRDFAVLVLAGGLDLAEVLKHGINHLKGLVDLLADLGARKNNLTTDEDQEHNFRLDHSVDETREQLGFVGAEVMMARSETFQSDGKLDVARADDVLNLEVRELGIETKLLDDACILAAGKLRIVLRLGSRHHHLARGKDERRRFGFANSHNHSSETLFDIMLANLYKPWTASEILRIRCAVPLGCTPHCAHAEQWS
jgi:hypothetical protein